MNNQPMNTLEAGNSRLQPWRVLNEEVWIEHAFP